MFVSKIKKIALVTSLAAMATPALAAYEIQLNDNDKLIFGGYIKADARYVDGDVAYKDQWVGAGSGLSEDASQFRIFANETRFNTKYIHGDLVGFIEMDFFGGGGNQVISNSIHPRLRHAFVKYKNITAGQTWTTFMNTSAIGETADFGSTMMGIAFIRQGQIRYTNGGLQLAIENPETWDGKVDSKADSANDDMPDLIAKYTFKGDWGNVSVAGVARQLNIKDGNKKDSETALGFSVAGRINTIGKDDLRFQVHKGELGRYVGTAAVTDLAGTKVEETTAYNIAYRHFWNETVRSTVIYGHIEGDESNNEVSQWGVNIFKNFTKELSMGFEVGQYSIDSLVDKNNNVTSDKDSMYGQFSIRYAL